MEVEIVEKDCTFCEDGDNGCVWKIAVSHDGKEVGTVHIESDTLLSFAKFKRAALEQLLFVPPHFTNPDWHTFVQDRVAQFKAVAVEVDDGSMVMADAIV